MRKACTLAAVTAAFMAASFAPSVHAAACPPAGEPVASLEARKAAKWEVPEPQRAAFALSLADCLADPDPHVRDELAFEGLQSLMRRRQVDVGTVQALRVRLLSELTAADPTGFRRPFAALTLAEVARFDRVSPYLDDAQRAGLVTASTAYLRNVRDYRGFEPRGWWDAAFWAAKSKSLVDAMAPRETLQGLQDRHNLHAFLDTFYVSLQEGGTAPMKEAVLPGVREALKAF